MCVVFLHIQVGSAQTAALQGILQRKVFFSFFFTEICLRILILLNTFFCVFLETFSSGGVPPDAPGDAKVSLGGASGDQVCFFIDF